MTVCTKSVALSRLHGGEIDSFRTISCGIEIPIAHEIVQISIPHEIIRKESISPRLVWLRQCSWYKLSLQMKARNESPEHRGWQFAVRTVVPRFVPPPLGTSLMVSIIRFPLTLWNNVESVGVSSFADLITKRLNVISVERSFISIIVAIDKPDNLIVSPMRLFVATLARSAYPRVVPNNVELLTTKFLCPVSTPSPPVLTECLV